MWQPLRQINGELGVLVALTGAHWHGRDRTLSFTLHKQVFAADGSAAFFYSTDNSWGTVHLGCTGNGWIAISGGELQVKTVVVHGPDGVAWTLDGPCRAVAGDRLTLVQSALGNTSSAEIRT